MTHLQGPPGELHATIQIKRAATGLVETFELVGHSDPAKLAEIVAGLARPAPADALPTTPAAPGPNLQE